MVEKTRIGMPLDEFIRLYDEEGPFELINGERKKRVPNVIGHSDTIRALFRALDHHSLSTGIGETYSETTFILPDAYDPDWVGGSHIPDVMFVAAERIASYKSAIPNYKERPLTLVPDFVAEIVSPNDKVSEMDKKIDQYLTDGVRLIWVIDPQRRKAVVYAPDLEQPIHLAGDSVMDGGDVIPGFQIPLSKLFD